MNIIIGHWRTKSKCSEQPVSLKLHGHEWVYEGEFYDPNMYNEEDPEITLQEYITLY